MKILHIFTNMNYVYTKALIELFYREIPQYYQEFLICDTEKNVPEMIRKDSGKSTKVHYLKNESIRLQVFEISKYLNKFDYTIYHFLPNDILLHYYYKFHRKLLNKTVWRIWGADLYNWKKEKIEGVLFNNVRECTRKNIPYIISEPMDLPEFKRQFGDKHIFLSGPDPKGYDIDILNKQYCTKKDNAIYILLGHSAVKTLHHKEILNKLVPYKNENVKIIIPLNYGDKNYAREVCNYANTLFSNDKIICINEKMDLLSYIRLLWQCDIAIIHSERQIAMGNITMLMYMKKKIFLMKDSIMDNYYRIEENLEIYDSGEIGNIPFEKFIKNEYDEKNRSFAIKEIDVNSIAKIWKDTFGFLKQEME